MAISSPRPSKAGRWIPCPASARLENEFQEIESEDAREGTAAHWVAAQVLAGHFELEELTDRPAPNGIIVTGEMVEHVEMYLSAVRSVTPVAVVESPLEGIPGMERATPDARFVTNVRGHIWEFKYGYKIVEAVDNWQMICYAVLLFIKHEWQLSDIVVTIVQPRPFHFDGRIRSWTITREIGWNFYSRIQLALAETQDPNAPARSGPHCDYCNALHACEAARRAAFNAVDITLNRGMASDLPAVELGRELTILRRAAEAIKLRLDAAESHGLDLINKGGMIPGWSVERALGRRQWRDEKDVPLIEALSGVTMTEQKSISPAQAEKRGVPKELVGVYAISRETGRKLVPRDGSMKAKEVFK